MFFSGYRVVRKHCAPENCGWNGEKGLAKREQRKKMQERRRTRREEEEDSRPRAAGQPIAGKSASQVALVVRNLPADAADTGDTGSVPGSGGSSGRGHGAPF